MPSTIYQFNRSSTDKKWIHEYYADDAENMGLINYQMDFYKAKTHCSFRTEESEYEFRSIFEYPDEHEDFDLEIMNDPKLQQSFQLLQQYYSQDGLSLQIIVDA